MKLDVGCGNRPTGDVNVDLFVRDVFNHRACGSDNCIDVKRVPNFVLCSCEFLPFLDGSFSEVYSGALIEHMSSPLVMFCELCRVCSGKLVVETCHRVGEAFAPNRKWHREHHVSQFNVGWFKKACVLFGFVYVDSYIIDYSFIFSKVIRLVWLPYSFGVVFRRVDE